MALFLGTWNVPTNKKLRVNSTDVTEVYCGGVLVWKYGGTGTVIPPGGKGHWAPTGRISRDWWHRDTNGVVTAHTDGVIKQGQQRGSLVSSSPDTGQNGAVWSNSYSIMQWIPE